MSYQVINPFIQFVDPINGNPLSAGEVYFGRMDSDPKNQPANRINVYAVQDNGSEVLLSQPIELNGAGQPSVGGSVKQIKVEKYTGENSYAVQVFSLRGSQKSYTPRATTILDSLNGVSIEALADENSSVVIAGVTAVDAVTHGSVRLQNPSIGNIAGQKHMVVRTLDENSNTNVHQEPNGYVDQGTVVKYDFMLDPFDIDQVNYRLGNIYTKTGVGTGAGFNGQNGVVVLGAKSEGDFFGVWPSINIGFSDDNANGIPLKVMYFDTSDFAWRTPMIGAWRESRSVTNGDYALANFKLYQAQSTGVTGNTKPSHSSGTASDGAINWLFVRDYAAAAGSIKPTVLIGDRNDMPKFGLPNVRAQFAKDSAYWNNVKQVWLNGGGSAGMSVAMDIGTDDWKFNFSGGGYLRHSCSNNFIQSVGLGYLMTEKIFSAGTAIDVRPTELALLDYASATTITSFTGRPNQRIYVHATNGNVTLQNGASLKLAGGVNRVMTADAMLCFVFNSGGTVAKQVIN